MNEFEIHFISTTTCYLVLVPNLSEYSGTMHRLRCHLNK